MKFYINGWEESHDYFMRIGRFGKDEIRRMIEGEVIEKDGNRFYINL